MSLIKKTREYILKEALLKPGDIVLLAVSGGMDSMTMAHILLDLREELSLSLVIANFDHQLRAESAAEADFIESFAAQHQIPFFLGSADIPSLARGGNVQETARRERYAYLRSLAAKLEADAIAVAHHSDDQAETVLLHLLRGSGLTGLGAMAAKTEDLIRPLLFTNRRRIEEFVAERGIEYREDSSNDSVKYMRNRIRLELLPYLQEYNPNIAETLNATADICREEDAVLDDLSANALAELWVNNDHALDKQGFDQLPLALRRRVLRKAYLLVMGESRELGFDQVESILSLKDEQSTTLPGGIIAYLRGNIYFAAEKPELPEYGGEYPLIIDHEWHQIGGLPWEYKAEIQSLPTDSPADDSLLLPAEMAGKLSWRTRRAGDSVISCGKNGKTKIKDIFIDRRIPIYQRNSWPLLTCGGEMLWLCGLWRKELPVKATPILIKARSYDRI